MEVLVESRGAQVPRTVFLGFDDDIGALELAAQAGIIAVQVLDLPRRRVRLWSPLFRCERPAIGGGKPADASSTASRSLPQEA
jgi:hypothetical protein